MCPSAVKDKFHCFISDFFFPKFVNQMLVLAGKSSFSYVKRRKRTPLIEGFMRTCHMFSCGVAMQTLTTDFLFPVACRSCSISPSSRTKTKWCHQQLFCLCTWSGLTACRWENRGFYLFFKTDAVSGDTLLRGFALESVKSSSLWDWFGSCTQISVDFFFGCVFS